MTEGIYLLLGSNMSDKQQQLTTAIAKITKDNQVVKRSSIYETAAWGNTDQPTFYNQVVQITTSFRPLELLTHLLSIEQAMGRVRKVKWGQRIIDIDILYYGSQIINTNELSLPHREIQNRRFTLVPMVEIAPKFVHPIFHKNQKELLSLCNDGLAVVLMNSI